MTKQTISGSFFFSFVVMCFGGEEASYQVYISKTEGAWMSRVEVFLQELDQVRRIPMAWIHVSNSKRFVLPEPFVGWTAPKGFTLTSPRLNS